MMILKAKKDWKALAREHSVSNTLIYGMPVNIAEKLVKDIESGYKVIINYTGNISGGDQQFTLPGDCFTLEYVTRPED